MGFDDGYQSGRLLDGCFGDERVVNCGCRSDELESQTEPVVRRGRRIVTTSKITDWVGDGNSFWTMRRVRDCIDGFADWEATEEETKREAWRWEEIDWCCKGSPFFYIYILDVGGASVIKSEDQDFGWLPSLDPLDYTERRTHSIVCSVHTYCGHNERWRSTSQLSGGCCKREIENEATCFKKRDEEEGRI